MVEEISGGDVDWGICDTVFVGDNGPELGVVTSKDAETQYVNGGFERATIEECAIRAFHQGQMMQTFSCLNATQQAELNKILGIKDPEDRDDELYEFIYAFERELFYSVEFDGLPLDQKVQIYSDLKEMAKLFTSEFYYALEICYISSFEVESDPTKLYDDVMEMLGLIRELKDPTQRRILADWPMICLDTNADNLKDLLTDKQVESLSKELGIFMFEVKKGSLRG